MNKTQKTKKTDKTKTTIKIKEGLKEFKKTTFFYQMS